ncbi:unnamed protein product, partial [Callosobruchus maculatus]
MYKPVFFEGNSDEKSNVNMFDPNLYLLNINTITGDKINFLVTELVQFNVYFVCLTEIGVKSDVIETINIPNYKLASYYCRPSLKCGGVGIWARSDLNCDEIDIKHFCTEKDIELSAVSCKIDQKMYIIVNCYRSPSGNVSVFFENISNVLELIYKPNVTLMVCGDFNFDPTNNRNNFNTLSNIVSTYNLKPVVEWSTRITETSSTIIDQIFTNGVDHTTCVIDNYFSDHRTILYQFLAANEIEEQVTYFRSFSESNISNFENGLWSENWDPLYKINDLNEAFQYLYCTFMYHFQNNFPCRRHNSRGDSKKWVNDVIKKSSAELKDLFILSRSFQNLLPLYQRKKHEHRELVQKTKKKFFQDRITNTSNQVKEAWKVISEIGNKKVETTHLKIKNGSDIVEEPNLIASLFNDFFIQASLDLKHKINVAPLEFRVTHFNNNKTFFLKPYCEQELLNLLLVKLKNKRSSGPDEIPCFIIKRVWKYLINCLLLYENANLWL